MSARSIWGEPGDRSLFHKVVYSRYGDIRAIWTLGPIAALLFGVLWMGQQNELEECERICELNGHESATEWNSKGCLCQDGHGVYNPYDERPAPE